MKYFVDLNMQGVEEVSTFDTEEEALTFIADAVNDQEIEFSGFEDSVTLILGEVIPLKLDVAVTKVSKK